jgi:hypothetical protein
MDLSALQAVITRINADNELQKLLAPASIG